MWVWDACEIERWSTHRLAALSASVVVDEVHTSNGDGTTRRAEKPLRHVELSRLKWEPSETHVGGRCR